MSRKKIISVILAHLMLLVCVTACQAASPRQTAQSQAADRQASEAQTETTSHGTTSPDLMESGVFDFKTHMVLLNSGYAMPIMGLGTYALDHDTCVNSVKTLLKNGGRLIDTAYMYHNEEAVGEGVRQAMEEYGIPREEIFVITKIYPSQFNDPEAAIDTALEKLDIGYIDMMLLHHPGTDDVKAYKAMETYVEQGKIRSLGLSNWYVDELTEFLPLVTITPALVQNEIHPYYQEQDVVPFIQEKGIVVQCWYPLGGRGHTSELLGDETIRSIAEAHGVSSAQVILRWDLQRGIVVIPGSSPALPIRSTSKKISICSALNCRMRKWRRSVLWTGMRNTTGTDKERQEMNILVLNGSPRPQGNTVKMVAAFRESAEKAGHIVNIVNVCRKNIKGCLACEYCHGKGQGQCVQKDDMQEVYGYLRDTNMLILASPIYYHGISGQLKCTIDRFYSALYPTAPVSLTKTAMFLSSGDPEMYEGAKFSFEGDFLGYLGLENMGMFTCAGDVKESVLEEIRKMAASL